MCTSRPRRFAPPPPPPAPVAQQDRGATAGSVRNQAFRNAQEEERKRALRSRGLQSTVLTGGLGVQGEASTARGTLLGQ